MAWWRAIGSIASRKAVVALVAVAGLYFWWVTTQYARINDFNQRQLSNAAIVLKNTIENAVRNVRNYKYDEKDAAPANQVCAFDDDQPYLSLDSCAAFEGYAGTFQSPEFSSESLSVVAFRSDQRDQTVRFRLQLATVLGELSFIEPFEVAFVANSAGVVRYQESPTARRWGSRLRWGERSFRDETATHTAEPRLHDVSQLLGEDAWKRASSVSSRTSVTLGGESAMLYLQPLAVDAMANGAPLVLGAVVPARDLMWRALAMDTYFVALLVWLLLFALLGIPFIKLLSLHRHERLTLRDVRHLYLSAAGLLTLWVFGVLAVDQYVRWQAGGDAGVKRFAEDLSAKFTDEVKDALHTLDRYDDIVLRHRDDFVGKAMLADWFNRSSEAPAPARPARLRAEYDEFTFGPHLYLERAQWIGPEGQQAWKITSDKTAKPVEVKTRPYFQAVNEGNLYQLTGEPYCFFIAPDRSIRDGKFYTFLSMRSRLSNRSAPVLTEGLAPYDTCQENQTGDTYVAVASLKLLTLLRPPLPVGYGFVVVNRDGRTMYHSDPQLSLRERFFSELGDEPAARALAFSGADGWLSTTYRERPHRLYFLPLPLARAIPSAMPAEERDEVRGFSGLYLVVFRDVSIEQAVVARSFLIGLIGPLLAQLAIVWLALWAVGVVSKHRDGAWSHWLWPDGSREPLHKRVTVATAVILVVSGLLFQWTPVGAVIFLALPLVTAGACIAIYASEGWRGRARSPLPHLRWYSLKFALLFVCLVGVPAITLFSLTLGHQFGKLIDSEEHGLWAQIDDVVLTVQSDARQEQHPGWYGQRAAEARRSRLASWPAPFDVAVPHDESTSLSWVVELSSWLDRELPVRSELTARQWYDDSRFSYNPPGAAGLPVGPVAWGGLFVACAAFVFWIGWCARHLFFADLQAVPPPGESTPAQAWAACTDDERFALMQVAEEHVANPRQRPVILSLIAKGLLVLEPDLRPRDRELESYIRNEGRASADLQAWEAAAGERSWHSVRLALFATMAVGAIFLLTTQPGLQSDLAGLASGIVSVGGVAVKIRDVVTRWVDRPVGS